MAEKKQKCYKVFYSILFMFFLFVIPMLFDYIAPDCPQWVDEKYGAEASRYIPVTPLSKEMIFVKTCARTEDV